MKQYHYNSDINRIIIAAAVAATVTMPWRAITVTAKITNIIIINNDINTSNSSYDNEINENDNDKLGNNNDMTTIILNNDKESDRIPEAENLYGCENNIDNDYIKHGNSSSSEGTDP